MRNGNFKPFQAGKMKMLDFNIPTVAKHGLLLVACKSVSGIPEIHPVEKAIPS
jgi:hypothetical protein